MFHLLYFNVNGLSNMQRFTLLHDGSVQGWQATYLAFHVAARLGAPLQVLHIDPDNDDEALDQRAAHVETGGHAAGVVIETYLLADFSMETLKEIITAIDGFFLPHRLIEDGEAVSTYLRAFSCPIWDISVEAKLDEIVVLVNDPVQDVQLISSAKIISQRLQQSLTALVLDDKFELTLKPELAGLKWMSIPVLSPDGIARALDRLHVSLVFVSISDFPLVANLPNNYIIYPNTRDA